MVGRSKQEVDVAIPSDISSPRAKLVYLYLMQNTEASIDDMADMLHIDKGSLLMIVGTLDEKGHVSRSNGSCKIA